jgi:hypothetical protein
MNIKITFDEVAVTNYSHVINIPEVGEFLKEFINAVVNAGINISSLKEVRFLQNYSDEIINFQRTHNLVEGYTDNGVLTGFGKTENIIIGDTVEHHVFFHIVILLNIFIDEDTHERERLRNLCLNAMFHEFCHVHDDQALLENIGFTNFTLNNHLDNVLYQIALSLWSEYFAHRISMNAFNLEIDKSSYRNDLLKLEHMIKDKDPIQKVEIYQLIHSYVQYLVRQIGNFHGAEMEETELSINIEDTIVYKYYNELSTALKILFDNYPKWDSYHELDKLRELVKKIWEDLGFVISVLGNDFFLLKNN